MNTKFIPPELQDTVVGLDGQRAQRQCFGKHR